MPTIRQKQLLIKADDYGQFGSGLDPWRRFLDILLDAHLTVSVGIVALPLVRGPRALVMYLRALVEQYGVEVWNHSLSHLDVTKMEPAALVEDIRESQRIISSEIGVTPRIYGAPYNLIDAASARIIVETKAFDGFYFFDKLVADESNITRYSSRALEAGTKTSFPMQEKIFREHLKTNLNNDLVTLQVHPQYWSDTCLRTFSSVVRSLVESGYQSITAADRLVYLGCKDRAPQPQQRAKSVGANIAFEERILNAAAAAGTEAPFSRADSAYYLRVLRRGTSEIVQFLRAIGFFHIPIPEGRTAIRILDAGCGVGNWSCAATLIPNSEVVALDREDYHVRHLAAAEEFDNLTVRIDDVAKVHFEPQSLSAIICNNTLSYLDLLSTLQRFQGWLVNSGRLFVGIQNRLYPLRDAIDAAGKEDWTKAQGFLSRIISNEGARYGLEPAFIRYHSGDELNAAATRAGLLTQRRNISAPGNYNELFGLQIFSGYLLIKTRASLNVTERIRNGAQPDHEDWTELLQTVRPAATRPGHDRLVKDLGARSSSDPSLDTPTLDALASVTGIPAAAIPPSVDRHESLIFYAKAKGMLAGRRLEGDNDFRDPMFGYVLALLKLVVEKDSSALWVWKHDLQKYLRQSPPHELAYWL